MIQLSFSNLKRLMRSNVVIKSVLALGLFASLLVFFIINAAPERYELVVGDIAGDDVYAPYDIVDKAATELYRKQAEESVQPVYKLDLTVQIDIEKRIDSFYGLVQSIKDNQELDKAQKLQTLEQESNISLNSNLYSALLGAPDAELKALRENTNYIINQMLSERITEAQLNDKRDTIREFFGNLPKKSRLNEAGADIAVMLLRPNMYYDEQTTMEKRKQARESVSEVIIKKDTKIINKGHEVTAQQIELLRVYGLLYENAVSGLDIRLFAGYTIMILVCLSILAIYLIRFDAALWSNNSALFLVSLIFIASLAIAVSVRSISSYLILLPAGTMLIALLINPRIAVVTNIISTIFISIINGFDLVIIIIMLLCGILGAVLVSRTHHRSSIVLTGLCISLTCGLIVFSMGFITQAQVQTIIFDVLYSVGGGILSAVLTVGALPFFETTFDIITPIKLLELSNPNQPLLRRLLIEAPGTYYHSILVGNLSEAAAEDVGANALLCRVGAYYHDIGKLKRPYFFKENQITQDNPHDKITPNLSALIITSHVKDGIEYAKKNKLPSSVCRIIEEHHGNTLVAYFYHKALSSDANESVDESKFRYAFRKPQTKEAAIVMLADSVEAYVRSLSEPSRSQVDQGVHKIIRDKLMDGQLDQCELTLKDLDKIAEAFIKVLAGIFHDRIEYPDIIDAQ